MGNFYSPGQDFKSHTVHQLTGYMCEGSPASQQAAMSALDNLSSNSDNLSKMIIKSLVDRGSTSIGMSQDVALKSPPQTCLCLLLVCRYLFIFNYIELVFTYRITYNKSAEELDWPPHCTC